MPHHRSGTPFTVPTDDGKLIEEHFGLASSGHAGFSLARMVAPTGWSEPWQQADFDELTILVKGRKQVEVDGETIILGPGEALAVLAGSRVRYGNPFDEPAEYWAVCIPAFTPDGARREVD